MTALDPSVRTEAFLTEDPSPLESFVAAYVEPRVEEFNVEAKVVTHHALMGRAARRQKVHIHVIDNLSKVLVHSGRTIGGMEGPVTSLVSHQARKACADKALAARHLHASGVPTPRCKTYHPSQLSTGLRHASEAVGGVVVKPTIAPPGRGVTPALRNAAEFEAAWKEAVREIPDASRIQHQVMVQEHVEGLDLRLHVVGEEVTAALIRIPLYVIGDGTSSVRDLAIQEMARRSKHAYFSKRRREITAKFLAPVGLSPETVLTRGELRLLTRWGDVAEGAGFTVDVTDIIHDDLRALAVDAMWAFPGMSASVVDIMTPQIDGVAGAYVLDLNPGANLQQFRYPAYGQFRSPHDALIEQMLKQTPQ